jgi:ribosomal protein L11 methylase PrmA
MRRWTERHRKLSETGAKIRDLELKASSKAMVIKTLGEELLAHLAEAGRSCNEGESLSRLITRGEQVIGEFEKTRTERDQLKRDLAKKRQELKAAEVQEEKAKTDLNEWQDKWEKAIQPLGLGRESIPDQAKVGICQRVPD